MSSGASSAGAIQTLICEDEPLAVRALREYLREVEWIEVVGEAKNGREAVRLIHKLEPDLIFMDVQMPGLSGVEVLETVTHKAAVVFTTAYDEYAISAFELGAVDYLMKPFGRDRLIETLGRVRVRLVGEGVWGELTPRPDRSEGVDAAKAKVRGGAQPAARLFARDRGGLVPVITADIVRIDATEGGVALGTRDRTLELDTTLTELMTRLDPADFVRVHRAHAINLRHVLSIRRYDERRLTVRLSDDSTLVASRRGSQLLRRVAG